VNKPGWTHNAARGAILAVLATLVLLAQATFAQDGKPNFSGHWRLDKSKSDFGSGPQPDEVSEVIDHHEPTLVVNSTTRQSGREDKRSVRYTTDGAENTNMVAGHTMQTKTHWEGGRLVTVVRDERGLQLTEVRSLSKDGKTQSVETDFGMGKQKLVMRKE
jgi:prophage tail gpP-like protein